MWTNRPAVSCNDGNACTKQDLCNNGRCVGKAYSCRSSYPQSICIQRSECVGDGTCRDVMRTTGTICRPAVDKCDQPERWVTVLKSLNFFTVIRLRKTVLVMLHGTQTRKYKRGGILRGLNRETKVCQEEYHKSCSEILLLPRFCLLIYEKHDSLNL